MRISDFRLVVADGGVECSARVAWEDRDFPGQELSFAIADPGLADREPPGDAFLAACFPLAAVFGEKRLRIESASCPMLIEGLQAAHAVWAGWGGMRPAAPAVEMPPPRQPRGTGGQRRSVVFLSGGVDGLHALWHNRRVYCDGDPAYIREALLIHGFDIGKRVRAPEHQHFELARRRLEPVATEVGLRLISCRTNLRHLPALPGFWTGRHNGAALAAVGHAAIVGPGFLFIGGTYPLSAAVPMGSHPLVDPLFSSQRVRVIHAGAHLSRLDKVRALANWPTALAALRVCPSNVDGRANCGRCEKCLATRLELLVAGVEETSALGPSLTPAELWEAIPPSASHRAVRYRDLLPALQARGSRALCAILEERLAFYETHVATATPWPGAANRQRPNDFLADTTPESQD
jgi:hypothetical protein